MNVTQKTLGELRKSAGISQAELAKRVGVINQCVSNWERGVAPIPYKHVDSLSTALNVTKDDITQNILSYKITKHQKKVGQAV
jgi:transcriptional regulator with XRE-family HTH domain